jgi:predicted RNase H-like HicB family nuclease
MSDRDYRIEYEPLPASEGGGWLATVPDLPGCMSDGATCEEAAVNVRDAIQCWIAAARRLGRPVPEPAHADVRPGLTKAAGS